MDIQLNFINNSNDANNSQIVIFQKNVAANYGELAVAWHVIQNCGQNENHPFVFPMSMQVGSSDSWGNYTPQLPAAHGQAFSVGMTAAGDVLKASGAATSQNEVQVLNALPQGSVSAGIYKMGRLLATKPSVAPGQTAAFQFKPTIWIGVASQVVQGEVMNSAILSEINTEISLLGIASADIVMSGGGAGPTATPFTFSLQNVVMA
ncbi:hypothetical protein [Sphingomonas sp. G-3-2-10]|uniref:hypothetical protein n=1 Tax=Sphingomonas sp. G-3-2-10 TaxID=2728838 RepID=UPI00146BC515|nr:hypothetical protein [Sphingomonas sp. G-3-2-10]NML07248.1 DUF2066 domain-containing protein [Sphingomonas sp. G-3-2-10]